jgi:hypothetical protein
MTEKSAALVELEAAAAIHGFTVRTRGDGRHAAAKCQDCWHISENGGAITRPTYKGNLQKVTVAIQDHVHTEWTGTFQECKAEAGRRSRNSREVLLADLLPDTPIEPVIESEDDSA